MKANDLLKKRFIDVMAGGFHHGQHVLRLVGVAAAHKSNDHRVVTGVRQAILCLLRSPKPLLSFHRIDFCIQTHHSLEGRLLRRPARLASVQQPFLYLDGIALLGKDADHLVKHLPGRPNAEVHHLGHGVLHLDGSALLAARADHSHKALLSGNNAGLKSTPKPLLCLRWLPCSVVGENQRIVSLGHGTQMQRLAQELLSWRWLVRVGALHYGLHQVLQARLKQGALHFRRSVLLAWLCLHLWLLRYRQGLVLQALPIQQVVASA
mmetsp:Transcript_41973/g.100023  ORF Transcript_41973/g.100023 Transcript_41973/m.100023 type:complete len:265 (-) Transcript_41973:375-1169(-)